jgi:hypothetical protein
VTTLYTTSAFIGLAAVFCLTAAMDVPGAVLGLVLAILAAAIAAAADLEAEG